MSTVPSTSPHALIDSLLVSRQKSSKGTRFIPYHHLQRVLTRRVVAEVVDHICLQDHRKPALVDAILRGSLRTVAALILLRQEELILDFIEHLGDRLDNKLPFEQTQISRISSRCSGRFFSEVQWEVIPHFFRQGGFHRKIMEDVIMPYTKEVRFDEGSGGEIFECVVAEGQHDFPSEKPNQSVTVIKKRIKMIRDLKESSEETFNKELQCLEVLRCLRHPNIIELLASYEQRGEYFLLFPRLPINLADFLKEDDRFGEFNDDVTFFRALSGLASAVEAVHELSIESEELVVSRIGYHHDIKPKNILVTRNSFMLTDFGLARLKMPDEGSQSLWVNTIGDYIAPECMDDNLNRQIVGRSIDIWALGCLITDVATYMVLGKDGVQDYRSKRRKTTRPQKPANYRFFEADGLRSSVITWFQSMTNNQMGSGIPSLVELVALMLQVDTGARPRASEVQRRLQYIYAKMMYRKVVQILDSEKNICDERNSDPSPFERLGYWFELERVKAWGNVLGMEDDRTYHDLFVNEPIIASQLSRILQGYYEEFRHHDRSSYDAEDATCSAALKSRRLSGFTTATVRSLASELWGKVPVVYQTRMDQAWRHSSLKTEDEPTLSMIEQASRFLPSPYSEIGKNAAVRRLSLRFWKEEFDNARNQRGLLIGGPQLEREYNLGEAHEIGWLHQDASSRSRQRRIRVFIEWVLYAPSWEEQTEEEKTLKTFALAEMLSQSKPASFRVLDCVGVAPPDEDAGYPGFAYVYRCPGDESERPNTSVKTLADLFPQKVMLEERFGIAACICSSIFHLHSANWLHKNLRTSNIVFFRGSENLGGTTSADHLEPYIVGFQHSRPDGETWYSDYELFNGVESQYRHPDYMPGKTRFESIYDYYSLGILLLEIGFWLPIASFRSKHQGVGKHAFKDILIQRYTPQLGTKMGTTYMNIVMACLKGEFSSWQDGETPRDLLDEFYWTVVAPLTKLNVA